MRTSTTRRTHPSQRRPPACEGSRREAACASVALRRLLAQRRLARADLRQHPAHRTLHAINLAPQPKTRQRPSSSSLTGGRSKRSPATRGRSRPYRRTVRVQPTNTRALNQAWCKCENTPASAECCTLAMREHTTRGGRDQRSPQHARSSRNAPRSTLPRLAVQSFEPLLDSHRFKKRLPAPPGAPAGLGPEFVPGVEVLEVLPTVSHAAVLELEDDAVGNIEVLAASVRGAALDTDDAVITICSHVLQLGPEGPSGLLRQLAEVRQ